MVKSSKAVKSEVIVKSIEIATRLAAALVLLVPTGTLHAQIGFGIPPLPSGPANPPKVLDHYPDKPSGQLAFTIPLNTLGFSTPGDNYLLRQESVVSLDFIDEDRLLFSFHVASGLTARRPSGEQKQQRIRAMVVSVSTGKVKAESEWTVPDMSRYLWMLNNGHFLLRTKDGLEEGDEELKTKSYLRSPERLLWIQMDPKQEYIIINSLERGVATDGSGVGGNPSPSDKKAKGGAQEQGEVLVARTMRRATGEVVRESRVPWTSQKNDWPMNSEGYLERAHEKGANWTLRLSKYLGGEGRVVGQLVSTCVPKYSFVSDSEVLVSRCDPERGWVLEGFSSDGKAMWQRKAAVNTMWPMMIQSSNGSRIAYESLLLKHAAERYKRMIGTGDLLGQSAKVFNAVDGSMLLETPLTPVFDGGGNVALSPSGTRVAVLNAGAIQVFELPAASRSTGSN